MNPDDFEKQLQRQPLRPPPAAWREEMLAKARTNLHRTAGADESVLVTGWRALLARIPHAWGAVAALWLVIIGVNSLMSGPAISVSAGSPSPRGAIAVWQLQRAQASQLANGLTDFPDLSPHRETPSAPPRPRSDRRRDGGLGELPPTSKLSTLA